MKSRSIYYRRKLKKIIIEEVIDGKCVYLKQLPSPEIMLKILEEVGNNKPKLKRRQCKNCKKPFRRLNRGLCNDCYKEWRIKVENPEYQKSYQIEKKYNISYEQYKKITEKCMVCEETSAVHLHHADMDKSNNKDENLVGLCAKCHQLIHSEKDGKPIAERLEKHGFKNVLFGSRKKYEKNNKSSNNFSSPNIEKNKLVNGE